MKKGLLSLVFALSALFSVAQAKFFIGTDLGYTAKGFSSNDPKADSLAFKDFPTSGIAGIFNNNPEGFIFNLVLGTEHFFGPYVGVRWEAGLGYSSMISYLGRIENGGYTKHREDSLSTHVNFDLMLDFVKRGGFTFGVFGGVGMEHRYDFGSEVNSIGFTGRTGITTLLGQHNRFDVYIALPIADVASRDEKGFYEVAPLDNVIVGASYKYVF